MPNEMEAKLHDLAQETLGEWLEGYSLPGYRIVRSLGNVYHIINHPLSTSDYLGKFKVSINVEELT